MTWKATNFTKPLGVRSATNTTYYIVPYPLYTASKRIRFHDCDLLFYSKLAGVSIRKVVITLFYGECHEIDDLQ